MKSSEKTPNRRRLFCKILTMGSLTWIAGKWFPRTAEARIDSNYTNVKSNVKTSFNDHRVSPEVDPTAYVHPLASVIGRVHIGQRVMVSPCASIRGDEGSPIFIGDGANVQDCCVVHALETTEGGREVSQNLYTVNGKKYAVFIGKNVSMAHQAQVHGPAVVGHDTFVGMQALVFKAVVGSGCVIEPGAKVVGVNIPDERYVPMGTILNQQSEADNLPRITESYAFRKLNEGVVHVNVQLADGYNGKVPRELSGGHH